MVNHKLNIKIECFCRFSSNTDIARQWVTENKYKKLWIATAYISKNKEGITQALRDEKSSLGTTSETPLASLPSDAMITEEESGVKERNTTDQSKRNTIDQSKSEIFSPVEKRTIPENSIIENNIVVDENSKKLNGKNPRAYSTS